METSTYDLLINHNPHTNMWYCFNREDYANYWNDKSSIKCLGIGDSADAALENYKSKLI